MNNDIFLNGIHLNLRQGNSKGIQIHLAIILKKAALPQTSPRLRTEINLEAVKALRALDCFGEAARLCDTNIANIPADCFDLLSALKRVRSLLYLDAGDLSSARALIDDTDGLELLLQGGQSLVNRTETEVTVETWLISTEIALAQNDLNSAQDYFNKAITRLSSEEAELRRKRVAFFEKRKLEQYYHDLSQMLNLYGLTLRLFSDDGEARKSLIELYQTVGAENKIALEQKKLPNVPLHSKLTCLLGEWSETDVVPSGIPFAEARRWLNFGLLNTLPCLHNSATPVGDQQLTGAASAVLEITATSRLAHSPMGSDQALDVAATAIEKMATVFSRIERVIPQFENYLSGEGNLDTTQRGFGGHLLDTDLFNLLNNVNKLAFTGTIKLVWDKKLFDSAIIKGYLPEIVRSGEATLYACDGFISDSVFKGQSNLNSVETARENFLLLTRMCFSIQTDNIQPDIIATALPNPYVSDRARLLHIRENDLVHITADLDEAAAGIEKDEGDMTFFDLHLPSPVSPSPEKNFASVSSSSNDDAAASLYGNAATKENRPEDTSSQASLGQNILEL